MMLFHITPIQKREFVLYVNPVTRTLDFILGISILKLFSKNNFSEKKDNLMKYTLWELCACIIFLVFFMLHNIVDKSYRFSIYYWMPMTAVIYTFSFQAGLISKFLSKRCFIIFGEISFGFYMIHFVVIYYALWLKPIYFSNFNDTTYALCIFLITLFLSFISYYLYELPVNRYLKKKWTKKESE